MKIEREAPEPKFIPVVITLETKEEVAALAAVMARVCSYDATGGALYAMYCGLSDAVPDYGDFFEVKEGASPRTLKIFNKEES